MRDITEWEREQELHAHTVPSSTTYTAPHITRLHATPPCVDMRGKRQKRGLHTVGSADAWIGLVCPSCTNDPLRGGDFFTVGKIFLSHLATLQVVLCRMNHFHNLYLCMRLQALPLLLVARSYWRCH